MSHVFKLVVVLCTMTKILYAQELDFQFNKRWIQQNSAGYSLQEVNRRLRTLNIVEFGLENAYIRQPHRFSNSKHKESIAIGNFLLKKRVNGREFREFLAYEIARLICLDRYIPEAYLCYSSSVPVVIQKIIPMQVSNSILNLKSEFNASQLDDYWFANLASYFLGGNDLVARNIGFADSDSRPIFFDLEDWFHTGHGFKMDPNQKSPFGYSVYFSFYSALMQNPHFNLPIDESLRRRLVTMQADLTEKLPRLGNLVHEWNLSSNSEMFPVIERIQRFIAVDIPASMSFKELYLKLFPEIPNGFEEILASIGARLRWGTDAGATIFWLMHLHRSWGKPPEVCDPIRSDLDELYALYCAKPRALE